MSLEELISTYGYIAITIGVFLEGETFLILGGFAAHRGYLELIWVIACAFLATFLNGQLLYFLGNIKGERFLEKRPSLKHKSLKVLELLRNHRIQVILGFRFLYGLRTMTPFLLGASKIPPLQFLSLNILGAFIWAIVFGVLGYIFGHTLEQVLGNIQRYEIGLFMGIALSGIVAWLIHFLAKRN